MTLTFTLYQELQSFIQLFSHPCGIHIHFKLFLKSKQSGYATLSLHEK